MKSRGRILVAPLNWGLGHATRCIPIIQELLAHNFEPVLASDGEALALLRKEFPALAYYTLPSYNIRYARNPKLLYFKLISRSAKILQAIKAENSLTADIAMTQDIIGIISDNRLGVYSSEIPSIYITHQLNLPGGILTKFPSVFQQKRILNFRQCWIPDFPPPNNLTGKMSEPKLKNIPIKFTGPVSRFTMKEVHLKYDLLVLLSGPEPQRSVLESIMLEQLKEFSGNAMMVRGVVENRIQKYRRSNLTVYNFLTSSELEQTLLESKLVICRSGYSSIMDLLKLEKPTFLIPTPGQAEQQYLAKRCNDLGLAPYIQQRDFKLSMLEQVGSYSMKLKNDYEVKWEALFSLFKGK